VDKQYRRTASGATNGSHKKVRKAMPNKQKEELIELRQLRYFVTLTEELHFARAAERLQMEQSPLSRAIREMERMLGVRLFERTTRSTRITRAGTVLLDYARRALALVEQASTSVRSAALGHSNQLRIGLSDCMAYWRMTEILVRYRTLNPEVDVSISEVPLHQQISWIRDGLLDASVTLDGSHRDGIEVHAIARDSVCTVIPSTHPLARTEDISTTDLASRSLILFNAESDMGAGARIEDFVRSLGQPRIAFRARSLGAMLTLVALGHGVGVVGRAQMMGIKRRDVVARPISGNAPSLVTYVLHSDCGVSEPLAAFIELARELLSEDSTAELS
jgi:DNA-binding transcriptional LysR family regulator